MRQNLYILLGLILLVAVLAGINAASYVQQDKKPDVEMMPNRSTYNSGSTGSRAFYDLLSETGRKVMRWQEKPFALLSSSKNPKTFVIIGPTRIPIGKDDTEQILKWVSRGGRLVIINRDPPRNLIRNDADRVISTVKSPISTYDIDPSNVNQMTAGVEAGKPLQPTVFTRNIGAVQPSRFASAISINLPGDVEITPQGSPDASPTPIFEGDEEYEEDPPPPAKATPTPQKNGTAGDRNNPIKQTPSPTGSTNVQGVQGTTDLSRLPTPFVHISSKGKNLLADFPYGAGRIVYLTDPYIVSNGGISLVDNAQLGLNVVSSDGLIAFDEFHQGYGLGSPFFDYFDGTPVIAIFWQLLLIVGVVFFTLSRRFGRPLPEPEPNRLSKLEYVTAMAELQETTRAYDLAIENIYTEFRRSVTRLFGADNFTTSRQELAALISERTKFDRAELDDLMRQCEEIVHGEPTNKREILKLSGRLREIEEALNIKRKRKEAFRK